jgi:CRISPR-associated protein Cmr2
VGSIFRDFSFPSVAEVACADFKEKAKELREFKEYEDKFFEDIPVRYLKILSLPKLNLKETLEGSWFYEENISVKKFSDELGASVNFSQIESLKNCLRNLYAKAGKPKKYYAILYLDGDNMGKWLSGEVLPEIQYAYNSEVWEKKLPEEFKKGLITQLKEMYPDKKARKILTPAIHSAISTALRNYAIEFVRKIVEEEHLGKLIYAGGDDVLAFVNLKDLFDVMEKLRWAFSGHIKFENGEIRVDMTNNSGFVFKDGVYYLTMGKNATCSMGVVIAHYKEPLKIVIDKVFEMNKKAKESGRNRFAICLLKHSGEERVGVAEWEIEINNKGTELTTKILKDLQDWMNKDRNEKRYISDGFIQKFKMEFIKLKETSLSEGIVNTELKRLVTRAYNGRVKEDKEEKRKFIEDFVENAKILFWRSGEGIDNFANLLEIASFINKKEE